MTDQTRYIVRPYISDDNSGLAVMWNESDDQWPGTFTHGVPFTEERMRKWMEQEVCLLCLVVEDISDGAIVGFGTLWENAARKDTCYVAVLNVHPAHQGRSLARRILTQMIDWATEHGYQRVTINTWPANIKSVPLYKKVGFFWVPETDVLLENYIPMIRQLELAQDFFARHHWYNTFQRELNQEEDDQRHPATGEMKVFVFRWEEDGDFLEVVIDCYAQTITGIETADVAAYAIVDESEPAQGFIYRVRWHVTNKRESALNVSILAEGEDGISLHYQTSYALAQAESHIAETTVVCAAEAPKLKFDKRNRNKTAPRIKTTLVLGRHSTTDLHQQMVALGTGLYYRQAVSMRFEPRYPSLLPGQEQIIHLMLRNRAGRPITGTVSIVPQAGLTTDWMRHVYEVDDDGYAGIPLKVTCDRPGALPLTINATVTNDTQPVAIAPKRLPLLVTPIGGVSAVTNPEDEYTVVENDFFQVVCQVRGGGISIANKAFKQGKVRVFEEAGPPFQPFDLRERVYEQSLEHGPGWATISTTVKSERFPGLCVARDITITASPIVKIAYRLVNTGTVAHDVQIRPAILFADIDRESGTVALPRKEQLIVTRASEFPSVHGDLPEEPEGMAEQWMAFSREGQTSGIIWGQDVVKHELWFQGPLFFSEKQTLEPQNMHTVKPLYLYSGPGDWRDVRRFWQRLNDEPTHYIDTLPDAEPPYKLDICPAPLVTLANEAEAQLCLESVRLQPVKGRAVIEPPADWTVECQEIDIEGVNADHPFSVPLRLTSNTDRVGAFSGCVQFKHQVRDEARAFTILRLGNDSPVIAEPGQQAEQPVWRINNGRCEWTVAPDFHAGVIAWHDLNGPHRPNHLLTAFPEIGNLGWLRPWLGGIWPVLVLPDEGPNWPGRLHDEVFTAEACSENESNALPWQGVRVTSSLTKEGFKGLQVEVSYLTVGGSNVLKVIFKVINESSAPRRVSPGLLVFVKVDGVHEHSVLYADDFQRKRMAEMCWSKVGSWAAIVNPDTTRAMVMVSGCSDTLLGVMDWGKDGGHFWYDDELIVPPFEDREIVGYLALTNSLEDARQYAALKNLGKA